MSTSPETARDVQAMMPALHEQAMKQAEKAMSAPKRKPDTAPTVPAVKLPDGTDASFASMIASLQAAAIEGAREKLLAAAAAGIAEAQKAMIATLQVSIEKGLEKVRVSATVEPSVLAEAVRKGILEEVKLPVSSVKALAAGNASFAPAILPVDPYYVESETGRDIRRALEMGQTFILLSGPSGSGKTFPAEQELRRLGRRYVKLSCADGVTRAELLGRQVVIPGPTGGSVTDWLHGVAVECARYGYVLILDEMLKMDALTLASLQSLLDLRPSVLTPWGETVTAAPGFAVIGTCNSLTDETGLYVEQPVSADLINRGAGALILADYLSKPEEKRIVNSAAPSLPENLCALIVDDLGALRKLYRSGQLQSAPSARTGMAVARLVNAGVPWKKAWALSLLNGMKPSEAEQAANVIGSRSQPTYGEAGGDGGKKKPGAV